MADVNYVIFENNFRSYDYTGASHWKKKVVAAITQDRVIEENLKRQVYLDKIIKIISTNQDFSIY